MYIKMNELTNQSDIYAEFFFFFLRAALAAYGSSWARGQIEAAAAGLYHSHSNTGFELHLLPTPLTH